MLGGEEVSPRVWYVITLAFMFWDTYFCVDSIRNGSLWAIYYGFFAVVMGVFASVERGRMRRSRS